MGARTKTTISSSERAREMRAKRTQKAQEASAQWAEHRARDVTPQEMVAELQKAIWSVLNETPHTMRDWLTELRYSDPTMFRRIARKVGVKLE